MRGPILVGL